MAPTSLAKKQRSEFFAADPLVKSYDATSVECAKCQTSVVLTGGKFALRSWDKHCRYEHARTDDQIAALRAKVLEASTPAPEVPAQAQSRGRKSTGSLPTPEQPQPEPEYVSAKGRRRRKSAAARLQTEKTVELEATKMDKAKLNIEDLEEPHTGLNDDQLRAAPGTWGVDDKFVYCRGEHFIPRETWDEHKATCEPLLRWLLRQKREELVRAAKASLPADRKMDSLVEWSQDELEADEDVWKYDIKKIYCISCRLSTSRSPRVLWAIHRETCYVFLQAHRRLSYDLAIQVNAAFAQPADPAAEEAAALHSLEHGQVASARRNGPDQQQRPAKATSPNLRTSSEEVSQDLREDHAEPQLELESAELESPPHASKSPSTTTQQKVQCPDCNQLMKRSTFENSHPARCRFRGRASSLQFLATVELAPSPAEAELTESVDSPAAHLQDSAEDHADPQREATPPSFLLPAVKSPAAERVQCPDCNKHMKRITLETTHAYRCLLRGRASARQSITVVAIAEHDSSLAGAEKPEAVAGQTGNSPEADVYLEQQPALTQPLPLAIKSPASGSSTLETTHASRCVLRGRASARPSLAPAEPAHRDAHPNQVVSESSGSDVNGDSIARPEDRLNEEEERLVDKISPPENSGPLRLTLGQKQNLLLIDPLIDSVELDHVHCIKCGKWIKVKIGNNLLVQNWEQHCAAVHKRARKEAIALRLRATKDAVGTPAVARLEIVASPPRQNPLRDSSPLSSLVDSDEDSNEKEVRAPTLPTFALRTAGEDISMELDSAIAGPAPHAAHVDEIHPPEAEDDPQDANLWAFPKKFTQVPKAVADDARLQEFELDPLVASFTDQKVICAECSRSTFFGFWRFHCAKSHGRTKKEQYEIVMKARAAAAGAAGLSSSEVAADAAEQHSHSTEVPPSVGATEPRSTELTFGGDGDEETDSITRLDRRGAKRHRTRSEGGLPASKRQRISSPHPAGEIAAHTASSRSVSPTQQPVEFLRPVSLISPEIHHVLTPNVIAEQRAATTQGRSIAAATEENMLDQTLRVVQERVAVYGLPQDPMEKASYLFAMFSVSALRAVERRHGQQLPAEQNGSF
ncbi:hypothetical protein BKA62DRAFT_726018 [Auriculariales sp. MPI-PUGE-AT-0066]|nr:hypothetical protein BKA62DRAFT_726018 [Auriculariales sp. MPI-PUGE-AT-0066]